MIQTPPYRVGAQIAGREMFSRIAGDSFALEGVDLRDVFNLGNPP